MTTEPTATCGNCMQRYRIPAAEAKGVPLHRCRLLPDWRYVGDHGTCVLNPARFEAKRTP